MTITNRAADAPTHSSQKIKPRIVVGIVLVVAAGFAMSQALAPESAAAAPVSQCSSVDNTPGLGIECDVTVDNNLDLATGATSSTITTRECHGAANTAPAVCSGPTVTSSMELVLTVSQCNSVLDGGGASLTCSIRVRNTITGNASATAATINQCDDSLAGGLVVLRACSPDGSTTTNATITQCNQSDNGGTSSMTCTVEPGSLVSAALPVRVDQCNSSANGGGSLIVCTVAVTTTVIPTAEIVAENGAPNTASGTGVGFGTGIAPVPEAVAVAETAPHSAQIPETSTRVNAGSTGILAHTGSDPSLPLGIAGFALLGGAVLILASKSWTRTV